MISRGLGGLVLALGLGTGALAGAQERAEPDPAEFIYREIEGRSLKVYVFLPEPVGDGTRADAILLFHGGGWSAGSPEWTFEAARRFAERGLAAIAVEYRLSGGEVTPIEAADDACAAFAWVRDHAGELGVTDRLAAYGVSAGGQVAALAATRGCPDGEPGPAALLLWSPALSLSGDGWFRKMLQGRAAVADYSPADHVNPSTPPTSIVVGTEDSLTPMAGDVAFCDQVVEHGGVCELITYDGLGHLLTRNLENQERDFDPDPEARADGIARQLEFLERMGFLPGSTPSPVLLARSFRRLVKAGRFPEARAMMVDFPRRWFENREGPGEPWEIGPDTAGPWADWDKEFRSRAEELWWAGGDREAVLRTRERNDYFRLLERGSVFKETVYIFDEAGRIEGLVIRAVGNRSIFRATHIPSGRTHEFLSWAREHAPKELEYLMPEGEIDPSGDRPRRHRALLERWRKDAGLPAVPKTGEAP